MSIKRARGSRRQASAVQVHCYVCNPRATQEVSEVAIRLIPGVSPFRLALREIGGADAALLSFPSSSLSNARIFFRDVDNCESRGFPEQLQKELLELPEKVLDASRITVDDGYAVFTVALSPSREFHIVYRIDAPIGPVGALVEDVHDHVPRDVTLEVMSTMGRSRATDIYRALCRQYVHPDEAPPADSPHTHHEEVREQHDKTAALPSQPEDRYTPETDSANKENPT